MFANGNPVSFRDPFGLAADTLRPRGAEADSVIKGCRKIDPCRADATLRIRIPRMSSYE
jgi:hypothetical protein